ncbi:MoaD/ThiS family protein [Niveibacterium umoris]|uniref:Molybdopterin converting factor small subunit n=1 Tax=Niveibacterium umoris TaxID=1193620 RepID=A0A840BT38_9RHOO|nr:MoaD/ThiS family protein [Niveibacterium umoris]MBB4013976.1 molybdopterin converting factor small subunit [Niveibacterium umoris]
MRVAVRLPTHLHQYSGGLADVQVDCAAPATLGDVLAALDARWPGVRHRVIDEQDGIRRHIRIFVGNAAVPGIAAPVRDGDEVMIVAALSGG